MKVIQVSFDASLVTIIMDDNSSLIDMLKQEDDSFKEVGNKIFYEFDENYTEECMINDVTNDRGVIQFESH